MPKLQSGNFANGFIFMKVSCCGFISVAAYAAFPLHMMLLSFKLNFMNGLKTYTGLAGTASEYISDCKSCWTDICM